MEAVTDTIMDEDESSPREPMDERCSRPSIPRNSAQSPNCRLGRDSEPDAQREDAGAANEGQWEDQSSSAA